MGRIDTSLEGYKYIGINLTQEQLNDLFVVNMMMKEDTGKDTPIHCVLLTLKCLGLLPPEMICDISNNQSTNDAQNIDNDEFQKRYGKFKR